MAVSVSTPEDVVNLALARIGFPHRIGSMFDGSMAARLALTIYGQTRDQLLRDGDWDFARKTNNLSASGSTAPAPWSFSYAYPSDALRVRDLIVATFDPLNPIPSRWVVANDPLAGKVILSATSYATIVYTFKCRAPSLWESSFVETLAASLGRRLAPNLNKEAMQMATQDEMAQDKIAIGEDG
jgi:hypothetical protein